ncbi:hypothetical protein ARMGADRAFT_933034 [Armillaria gallica]|uniref:Uncharacterized protein n=1 Tax=Armillaria gallica TaxID=47427 RepID=A0A2H3DQ20_ARMGA|nr:hypothetical protein ARMGADRAFT_933034 [Armillaria gallica]
MPCVGLLPATPSCLNNNSEEVEDQILWLPSALDSAKHVEGCRGGVVTMEEQLCEVQCRDALNTIHGIIQVKKESFVTKYQVTHITLVKLKGLGAWTDTLQVLEEKDVMSLEGAEFMVDNPMGSKGCYSMQAQGAGSVGQGYKVVSWIWTVEGALGDGSEEHLHESVKVEWLKSQAHMQRWQEQVRMVRMEMACVLMYLEWCVQVWVKRGNDLMQDAEISEGRKAYAARQAAMWCLLGHSFSNLWDQPLAEVQVQRPLWTEEEAQEPEAQEDEVFLGIQNDV